MILKIVFMCILVAGVITALGLSMGESMILSVIVGLFISAVIIANEEAR